MKEKIHELLIITKLRLKNKINKMSPIGWYWLIFSFCIFIFGTSVLLNLSESAYIPLQIPSTPKFEAVNVQIPILFFEDKVDLNFYCNSIDGNFIAEKEILHCNLQNIATNPTDVNFYVNLFTIVDGNLISDYPRSINSINIRSNYKDGFFIFQLKQNERTTIDFLIARAGVKGFAYKIIFDKNGTSTETFGSTIGNKNGLFSIVTQEEKNSVLSRINDTEKQNATIRGQKNLNLWISFFVIISIFPSLHSLREFLDNTEKKKNHN